MLRGAAFDGNRFGIGNWGREGFDKFFETHDCNALCAFLGLKPRRTKEDAHGGGGGGLFTFGLPLPPPRIRGTWPLQVHVPNRSTPPAGRSKAPKKTSTQKKKKKNAE